MIKVEECQTGSVTYVETLNIIRGILSCVVDCVTICDLDEHNILYIHNELMQATRILSKVVSSMSGCDVSCSRAVCRVTD